jgi:hypothetical protein
MAATVGYGGDFSETNRSRFLSSWNGTSHHAVNKRALSTYDGEESEPKWQYA